MLIIQDAQRKVIEAGYDLGTSFETPTIIYANSAQASGSMGLGGPYFEVVILKRVGKMQTFGTPRGNKVTP